MRTVEPRAWLTPWLLVSLALVVLWSCQGCEKPGTQPPASGGKADTESSMLSPLNVEMDLPIAELPVGLEFGPAEMEPWLRHAGTVDAENRYASVVMIARENLASMAPCSGVLAGPHLVFTAGSCVCVPGPSSKSTPERLSTAPSCAEQVAVMTVAYGGDSGPKPRVRTAQLRNHEGTVRAHPRLELRVDSRGRVISRKADLAAIFLKDPVQGHFNEALLPETEVHEGEPLVMVGYGDDEFGRGTHDVRYYRKNKAIRPPMPGDDRILYEQEGAYVYNGFAGGPCFREESAGRWWVGIAVAGSEENFACTSIYAHREWVHEEMQRAARGGRTRP